MCLCSCWCSVGIADRADKASLVCGGEEERTFLISVGAGREDRVLSTVPRANYSEAVRHTFYFIIIDLEEGQTVVLQEITFPSLCVGRLFLHLFKVCNHWHFQLIGLPITQPRIYWSKNKQNI